MTEERFPRVVSLACHDLRTPLATIFGFARTLTRTEVLDERSARFVGMIESASEQMTELLDQLGVAARIEAGRYDPALVANPDRLLHAGDPGARQAELDLGRRGLHVGDWAVLRLGHGVEP